MNDIQQTRKDNKMKDLNEMSREELIERLESITLMYKDWSQFNNQELIQLIMYIMN